MRRLRLALRLGCDGGAHLRACQYALDKRAAVGQIRAQGCLPLIAKAHSQEARNAAFGTGGVETARQVPPRQRAVEVQQHILAVEQQAQEAPQAR